MGWRNIDTTKMPKVKENQLWILKIYAFCWKIQQRALGPGESAAGVTYLSENIHEKLPHLSQKCCCNLELEHSRHIVKVDVEATC